MNFSIELFAMDFMDWDSHFVFNPIDLRLKIDVEVYDGIVSILNLKTRCSNSAASLFQWWVPAVLFFFWDMIVCSGTSEIWSYVRGHCFGCSLLPGTPLNSPCKLASWNEIYITRKAVLLSNRQYPLKNNYFTHWNTPPLSGSLHLQEA